MNATGNRLQRLAVPVRVVVQRFTFAILIGAAFAIMILGKADTVLIERFRLAITDAAAPVLEVISHPVRGVRAGVQEVNQLWYLRGENARLRDEVARLSSWQAVARRLEGENAIYRGLLRSRSEPQVSFASARVIGDSGGPFVRTLLVNAGSRDGIADGQGVVAEAGLVGRIAAAGHRSSRILLVTDLNSRIPVVIEGSRYRALLAGDNSNFPRLTFLTGSARVSPGDRVVTSGHGGLLPSGVPVGTVAAVDDAAITVQPFVDWDRLEYVRILRFDLPRLSAARGAGGRRGR